MKILLILALFAISGAMGGTREAEPGEERRALALWKKWCDNGREGGEEGDLFIHCKHPLPGGPDKRKEDSFEVILPDDGNTRTQYIFVKPNPVRFTHKIRVRPGSDLEPKTIVYVKPAEFSHTYKSETEVTPTREHKKPELVFLKGNNGGVQQSEDYDDFIPTTRSPRQRKHQRSPPKVDDFETLFLDHQAEPIKSLDRVIPIQRKA